MALFQDSSAPAVHEAHVPGSVHTALDVLHVERRPSALSYAALMAASRNIL